MRKIIFLSILIIVVINNSNGQYYFAANKAYNLAHESVKVQNALSLLNKNIETLHDTFILRNTFEAVNDSNCPIYYLKGLSHEDKLGIIRKLRLENLIPYNDSSDELVYNGIFPEVRYLKNSPVIPQPFISTAGGGKGHHHNYPGGLAVHESGAMEFALEFGKKVKLLYGIDDKIIDDDLLISTMVWHDWSKVILYQYNSDGSIFDEYYFGGNGRTDDLGKPGNSIEMGHHILSLAEIISRNFPIKYIIALASVHTEMLTGNEYRIVNAIRAASIIAKCDPVKKGYLRIDSKGNLKVNAGVFENNTSDSTWLSTQVQQLPEYVYCHLADWDWIYNNIGSIGMDDILLTFAPKFGFDTHNIENYNWNYRYKIYSTFTSEALYMGYCSYGLNWVEQLINTILDLDLN